MREQTVEDARADNGECASRQCVPECVPEDPHHHCTAASTSSRADVVPPLGQRGAGSGTRAAERVTSLRTKDKQYLCQPRQVYGKRGYHRTGWHSKCRLGLYTRLLSCKTILNEVK